MKLLLTCIAVVLLASNVELVKYKKKKVSVEDALQGYLPGMDAPNTDCGLQIDGEDIKVGEEVCPGDTTECPTITYTVEAKSYLYTVLFMDCGYADEDDKSLSDADYPYLLGMFVNVCDLSNWLSGCVVVPYRPPCVTPSYGLKTITLFILEQKEIIELSTLENYSRLSFDIAEFSKNNTLCDPACGSCYTVQFPEDLEGSCDLS